MNLTSYSRYQPRSGAGQFIEARVSEAVVDAITDWAERVLGTAQGLVPVRTGALRDSGHVTVTQSGKTAYAAVTFDAPYSVYVEFGTGIRGAASPGAGPGPYNPVWPGMPAQPFLRPAYDEWEPFPVALTEERIYVALARAA